MRESRSVGARPQPSLVNASVIHAAWVAALAHVLKHTGRPLVAACFLMGFGATAAQAQQKPNAPQGTSSSAIPAAAPAASTPVDTAPAAAAASAPTPLTSSTTVVATDAPIVEARDAYRRRDSAKLNAVRTAMAAQSHPLTSWADYWELTARLGTATAEDVEAFYKRWQGRYVEDRLRNDWLLELGRRREWGALAKEFPRFRMNDDREVTCYAVLTKHLAAKPNQASVKAEALAAWAEQRDTDDGCQMMAATLLHAQVFTADDVWAKVRSAVEAARMRTARQAAALLVPSLDDTLNDINQNPLRYLNTKANHNSRQAQELAAITLARVASTDPDLAATSLRSRWQAVLSPTLSAWTWGHIGKQAAQKLLPNALEHFIAAHQVMDSAAARKGASKAERTVEPLSDDALAWGVRAALRSNDAARWTHLKRYVETMRSGNSDPAWPYWLARSKIETATPGAQGDAARASAQEALRAMSTELHFYGALAAESLNQSVAIPAAPTPLGSTELVAAKQNVGLQSALAMIAVGLREEGVREWNYSLRGMDDRQLLAAAQWACDTEVWDRCINTSDRTRNVADMKQRYPTPFRRELLAKAREVGLDAAYVYGLIRQESRFIMDARSSVGASGLMQIMPATARWTAGKLGLTYKQEQITDPALNLTLGTQYLKLVLDDFGGSQAMAAAAYNAGPSRPRRWREGTAVDAAAWAESIPFNETRDYVKKVLTNAVVYTTLLGGQSTLRGRLGATIGPREPVAPSPNKDLP